MAVLVNFSILPKRKKRTYLFMIWILHHLPPSLWVEKSKATRSLGNWRLWLQVVFMAEKNLGEQIGPWSLFHRFSPTKSSRNKEAFFCRASLKNNNESSRCYVRVFRLDQLHHRFWMQANHPRNITSWWLKHPFGDFFFKTSNWISSLGSYGWK